ncbi:APC family permease [Thiomicrorhabdus sp. ZW0627]|uniref:APC family permease n=1 Tax=Thiomicrorhabdus sp. ZW0627 TaxID=3039774 RepID=UPI0024370DB4|nr:APC family permease [Thiomicrorhabdus sp. ZW0627]MDG6772749.1 APC family permease [Thiomicrorhabdus sp. ZW0627]
MKIPLKKTPAIHRPRNKVLGVPELIAIALGGMVGGGIFTILGISVSMIGVYTPLAIALGGIVAAMAAYSYIKLGVYYKDEGSTYAFYKKTFPKSPFAASLIGWWVIFGYISTLALYSYTFASYAISGFTFADNEWIRKLVAGGIISVFTLVNILSVKGMGKIEDLMVYTKLVILVVISFVLINNSNTTLPTLIEHNGTISILDIMIVASITFVAYEGFELVINAVNEMEKPEKNIPRAIYAAIFLAILIYLVIALGAILTIPFADIIQNKEYALASGADKILGHWGTELVIIGALLATSSAISGTVFGASRQMSAIAEDRYLPAYLTKHSRRIPVYAVLTLSALAFVLVLSGSLQLILEFGSVTFLIISLLMAFANFRIRHQTNSSAFITLTSLFGLAVATVLVFYSEISTQPVQMALILGTYILLTIGAWLYAKKVRRKNRLGVLG